MNRKIKWSMIHLRTSIFLNFVDSLLLDLTSIKTKNIKIYITWRPIILHGLTFVTWHEQNVRVSPPVFIKILRKYKNVASIKILECPCLLMFTFNSPDQKHWTCLPNGQCTASLCLDLFDIPSLRGAQENCSSSLSYLALNERLETFPIFLFCLFRKELGKRIENKVAASAHLDNELTTLVTISF